jgi:dihydroorotase
MYHKVGLTAAFRLGEPGFEERETIVNGLCCRKSGFTVSLCNPTLPIIDNQSQVNFVQNKAVECTQLSQLAL